MKYKHIPAFLHNFTDSFMSLVNYSGDAYAVDTLGDFLREGGGVALEVSWVPSLEVKGGQGVVPPNLWVVLLRYSQWIPSLAESMRVDPNRIIEMRTVFSVDGGKIRADTEGVDDRGRVFKVGSKFWI